MLRRRQHAGQRPEWRATCQFVRPQRRTRRERSNQTRSTTAGMSLQATNTDELFGHGNRFVIGASFDYGVTRFNASAELGTIGSNYVVSGGGLFLGQSGDPVSIGPVSLRTTNRLRGMYALDTFDVTKNFRSQAADASTTAPSRLRIRSAARSMATRHSSGSIRSLAAPTRSPPACPPMPDIPKPIARRHRLNSDAPIQRIPALSPHSLFPIRR